MLVGRSFTGTFGFAASQFFGQEGEGGGSGADDDRDGFTAITTEAELNRVIGSRLKRAKASTRAEVEAEWEAKLEAATEKATGDLEARLKAVEGKQASTEAELKLERKKNLQNTIGQELKLPQDLTELLKGDTEEEMREHATALAKVVKPIEGEGTSEGGDEEAAKGTSEQAAAATAAAAGTSHTNGHRSVNNDSGTRGARRGGAASTPAPYKVISARRMVSIDGSSD